MENGASIHTHAINGVFEVRSVQGKLVIGFNATMLKRFSIAVAYFTEGLWRLRYRLIVTHQDGVLCFPLYKTLKEQNGVYHIPAEYDINTALVIGIDTAELESEVKLRIYANESGSIEKNFNGYDGTVKFDKFLDKAHCSESLKGRRYGNAVRFDRNLYKFTQHGQPAAPNIPNQLQQCQSYRINIYGEIPMSMFKMRIENRNDALHVLNKTSGIFEVIITIIAIEFNK